MRPDIVHDDDVRMVQQGRRPRFLREAREQVGIRGETRGQDLQGDVAVQTRVVGPEHLAHPAPRDQRLHPVGANLRSG